MYLILDSLSLFLCWGELEDCLGGTGRIRAGTPEVIASGTIEPRDDPEADKKSPTKAL